jgi:hypothetical protein
MLNFCYSNVCNGVTMLELLDEGSEAICFVEPEPLSQSIPCYPQTIRRYA